jgi:hypothetical protein
VVKDAAVVVASAEEAVAVNAVVTVVVTVAVIAVVVAVVTALSAPLLLNDCFDRQT